jgi:23S rRNA (pseudouridine1915-N3)-methyltransferase
MMRVQVIAVGRPRGPIAEAIGDYESRAKRYFQFSAGEVREEAGRSGSDVSRVKEHEGERLLARIAAGARVVALHRGGETWSSGQFARYLGDQAIQAGGGVSFLIGGAFGLADTVLNRALHLVSLSACTLPHDLARLVLTEQLYRAGTIGRGEPYHKGPSE